jgi:predicted negative regulator of RcsB-dependent stress response
MSISLPQNLQKHHQQLNKIIYTQPQKQIQQSKPKNAHKTTKLPHKDQNQYGEHTMLQRSHNSTLATNTSTLIQPLPK